MRIRLFDALRELRRAHAAHSDDHQSRCEDQGTVCFVVHTIVKFALSLRLFVAGEEKRSQGKCLG